MVIVRGSEFPETPRPKISNSAWDAASQKLREVLNFQRRRVIKFQTLIRGISTISSFGVVASQVPREKNLLAFCGFQRI